MVHIDLSSSDLFHINVCYEKFVTHLLLYTVANVWRIFRNRRYYTQSLYHFINSAIEAQKTDVVTSYRY